MDLIAECLDLFENSLFIIDEFHNLSKSNILNENDNINKLLISKNKILYMSATPKIYDIENDKEYKEITGDIVYKMNFNYAIENKYITDYKIWLPNNEDKNDEMKNKCKFLFDCIIKNGSRKIIIYCVDTTDMIKMMDNMNKLNEYYILELNIDSISCENSDKERKKRLEIFENNDDKIQLLFNIKILNECIDIPCCDSIYISYIPKNKITTIQRLSRATRIDKNNPYKIANIYLWCNENDEILSSIKEYDLLYNKKIVSNIQKKFIIDLDNVAEWLKTRKDNLKKYIIIFI